MRYAGFWPRLVAGLVDFSVYLALHLAFSRLPVPSKAAALAIMVPWVSLSLLYTIWMHARFGQTLGKMLVRVRVQRVTGEAIGWSEALTRSSVDIGFCALWYVEVAVCVLGLAATDYPMSSFSHLFDVRLKAQSTLSGIFDTLGEIWFWSELLVLLFNRKRRALHDFIAGTVVVHVNRGTPDREPNS